MKLSCFFGFHELDCYSHLERYWYYGASSNYMLMGHCLHCGKYMERFQRKGEETLVSDNHRRTSNG